MALPIRRSMGNAQSRNTALGRSPQYGSTTNPNGAQTASRMTLGGRPVTALAPAVNQFSPQFQINPGDAVIPQQAAASVYEADPAPAPYAGGNVPGVAQYYRNTALQGYRSPANSAQQSSIARSVQSANPGADMRSANYSPLNGYDGFTAEYNNPNRLRPDQKFEIAQQGARNYDAYDPTNQGGNRFAAGAARIQANQAYDQAAIAAGTQANTQRMQGIAADSGSRAMDPNSKDTAFSYANENGEMVSTNRLGKLQQLQQALPDDPNISIAIAQEKQRQSALGAKQEAFRERYAAANGGLSDKRTRRLENKGRMLRRAVNRGIISEEDARSREKRMIDHETNMQNFQKSETKLRRSALDAANAKERNDALSMDNSRMPNGQLRDEARFSARSKVADLVSPDFTGDPIRDFRSQVVRSAGLDGTSVDASDDANKIFSNAITSPVQALAFAEYWNAMSRSDADWIKKAKDKWLHSPEMAQKIDILSEMSQIPPQLMPQWFEENKHRLTGAPVSQSTQDNGPHSGIPVGQDPNDYRGRFPVRGY